MYATKPSFTGPNAAAGPPVSGAAVPIVMVPVIALPTRAGSGHDEVWTVHPDVVPPVAAVPPEDDGVVAGVVEVGAADTRGAVAPRARRPRPPPPRRHTPPRAPAD